MKAVAEDGIRLFIHMIALLCGNLVDEFSNRQSGASPLFLLFDTGQRREGMLKAAPVFISHVAEQAALGHRKMFRQEVTRTPAPPVA